MTFKYNPLVGKIDFTGITRTVSISGAASGLVAIANMNEARFSTYSRYITRDIKPMDNKRPKQRQHRWIIDVFTPSEDGSKVLDLEERIDVYGLPFLQPIVGAALVNSVIDVLAIENSETVTQLSIGGLTPDEFCEAVSYYCMETGSDNWTFPPNSYRNGFWHNVSFASATNLDAYARCPPWMRGHWIYGMVTRNLVDDPHYHIGSELEVESLNVYDNVLEFDHEHDVVRTNQPSAVIMDAPGELRLEAVNMDSIGFNLDRTNWSTTPLHRMQDFIESFGIDRAAQEWGIHEFISQGEVNRLLKFKVLSLGRQKKKIGRQTRKRSSDAKRWYNTEGVPKVFIDLGEMEDIIVKTQSHTSSEETCDDKTEVRRGRFRVVTEVTGTLTKRVQLPEISLGNFTQNLIDLIVSMGGKDLRHVPAIWEEQLNTLRSGLDAVAEEFHEKAVYYKYDSTAIPGRGIDYVEMGRIRSIRNSLKVRCNMKARMLLEKCRLYGFTWFEPSEIHIGNRNIDGSDYRIPTVVSSRVRWKS
jgi:hypothetical protein